MNNPFQDCPGTRHPVIRRETKAMTPMKIQRMILPLTIVLIFLAIFDPAPAIADQPLVSGITTDGRNALAVIPLEGEIPEDIKLDITGPWRVIRGHIVRPGDISRSFQSEWAELSERWHRLPADIRANMRVDDSQPLGFGVATYSLRLQVPHTNKSLAIRIQSPYSAYELWLNRKLIVGNGRISENKQDFQAYYHTQFVPLPPGEVVDVTFIVANFEHRAGGVLRPPQIVNLAVELSKLRSLDFSYLVVFGALIALLFFQFAYFIRTLPNQPEWSHLWFCGLSVLLAMRLVMLQSLPEVIYPDFPQFSTKVLEYLTIYLSPALYVGFLSSMFPGEFPRWFRWLVYVPCATLAGITLTMPVHIFSRFQDHAILFILAVALFSQVATIIAWKRNRNGAAAVVIFTVAFVFTLMNDALHYLHTFDLRAYAFEDLTPFGIALLSIGYSIALGSRSRAIYDQARHLSEDLKDVAESLEIRVQERTADLEEARHQAEHTAQEKSTFLATASHDLRQPIHALSIFNQSLLYQVDSQPELKRLADKQQQLVMSLSNMLESMLDVSKLEAGTVQASPQIFQLRSLFRSLHDTLDPVATRHGVKLRFVSSDVAINADPFLLGRIIANLVINAINASPDGQVLVGVRTGKEAVRLQVLDNGSGIPLEAQKRIFDQFVQVQDDSRPAPTGLGLGLSIVTNLSQLMNLQVSLTSQPDKGTVVTITIPRGNPDQIEQAAAVMPENLDMPPDQANSDGEALPRMVILAVDNDPPVLDAMTEILRRWGHSAMGAGSAHEAIRLLDELGKPDLLLCDYRLEGRQTGFEVIAHVRSYFGRDIPAAIITGATSAEDLRALKNSGLPVLHKPINFPRMIKVLKEAASQKQSQSSKSTA